MGKFGIAAALIAMMTVAACGQGDDREQAEAAPEPEPAVFIGEPVDIAGGTRFAVAVDREADPQALAREAMRFCGTRQVCQVMGWVDEANVPRAMPLVARESDTIAFNYLLNRRSSVEQIGWDCRIWPGAGEDCINPE